MTDYKFLDFYKSEFDKLNELINLLKPVLQKLEDLAKDDSIDNKFVFNLFNFYLKETSDKIDEIIKL